MMQIPMTEKEALILAEGINILEIEESFELCLITDEVFSDMLTNCLYNLYEKAFEAGVEAGKEKQGEEE